MRTQKHHVRSSCTTIAAFPWDTSHGHASSQVNTTMARGHMWKLPTVVSLRGYQHLRLTVEGQEAALDKLRLVAGERVDPRIRLWRHF